MATLKINSYRRWATLTLVLSLLLGGSVIASPAQQTPQPTATPIPTRPILLTDAVPDPHQAGVTWFAPTGHTLRGAFLAYWQLNGGLAQFGYPITEEFTEPNGSSNKPLDVQYFERNRFEHHPENVGTPYEVLLGRLGLEFHAADAPAAPMAAPAQYLAETGHNLSGPFKVYWEAHGGLSVYGYPISEQVEEVNPVDHKKYVVQYFERARMELHPENAGSQYEVLLGLLGRQSSQKKGYPYGWYPRYGHAADYSWLAGDLAPTRTCAVKPCACPVFSYDYRDQHRFLYVSPGWAPLTLASVSANAPWVLIGHLATPAEEDPICKPGYFMVHAQPNPAH